MRRFANIFLVLFLLTALLAIVTACVRLFLPVAFPRLPLQLLWTACFLFGFGIYLGFGFNRHLPKIIFIPLLLWLIWALLDYWPLESVLGTGYHFYAGLIQLIFVLTLLNLNRLLNRRSLLLAAEQFSGPAFSFSRLLLFALINVIILPLLLVLIGFSLTAGVIDSATGGFVRLKPNGLYMSERIYQRGDKSIHLVGMIHLARAQYYNQLQTAIPDGRTLILLEGVTDRQNLLKERFNYNNLAAYFGLTPQQQHFQGHLINRLAPDKPFPAGQLKPDLLPADIDLHAFAPETIEVLNALAKYVLNAESPLQGYLHFNQWVQEHATIDMNRTVMADLINKRNRNLLSYLPRAMKKYDNLVIPWGALHLKGIEEELIARGFTRRNSRERLSIDFLELPYGKIWRRLSAGFG